MKPTDPKRDATIRSPSPGTLLQDGGPGDGHHVEAGDAFFDVEGELRFDVAAGLD